MRLIQKVLKEKYPEENWEWIENVFSKPDLTREEMKLGISGIHFLIRVKDLDSIDSLIKLCVDNSVGSSTIILLLRSSFTIRHNLTAWNKLRNKGLSLDLDVPNF